MPFETNTNGYVFDEKGLEFESIALHIKEVLINK